MGAGRWDDSDWKNYSAKASTKTVDQVFTTRHGMKDELNPLGVAVRESRDSADNPNSTAAIFALDVTGSMGQYAHAIATKSLGTLFGEILNRKPITDPHLMFMAVGDAAARDTAPLQVSQFEADNRIIEQLTGIFIEGGGGGNYTESYQLPWYFAARHTSIDCFEKRGKKGFLFTMGDERAPDILTRSQVKTFIGDDIERDLTSAELLQEVQKMYHVFHIVIKQGNGYRQDSTMVSKTWKDLLGEHALELDDHTKLAEVVVSTMQIVEGADKDAVIKSWSGDTSLVVASAVRDLKATGAQGKKREVVRL